MEAFQPQTDICKCVIVLPEICFGTQLRKLMLQISDYISALLIFLPCTLSEVINYIFQNYINSFSFSLSVTFCHNKLHHCLSIINLFYFMLISILGNTSVIPTKQSKHSALFQLPNFALFFATCTFIQIIKLFFFKLALILLYVFTARTKYQKIYIYYALSLRTKILKETENAGWVSVSLKRN